MEVGATGMSALHHSTEDKDVLGKVKEALIDRIGPERFQLWFGRHVTFGIEGEKLVVGVSNEFALNRLRNHYVSELRYAAALALGNSASVQLQLVERPVVATPTAPLEPGDASQVGVLPNHKPAIASPSIAFPAKRPSANRRNGRAGAIKPLRELGESAASRRNADNSIDSPSRSAETNSSPAAEGSADASGPSSIRGNAPGEAMTFANFAAGSSNQLAHTAAQMLSSNPGDGAPLCFWGATGTGKTHLLHAIKHELRTRHRMARVILMSAEDFTNEFLGCVRGSGLPAFRKRYRDLDALLIDNIQFFGGKSATLREVLYTVDTIISRRRPLVLASDRPPMEIEGLSSELAGRMSSGLVCGINPHELEVRRELLKRESLRSYMPWDSTILEELALRTTGDGRVIQGIGRLVSTLQRMYRRMPSMQEIVREAGDLLQRGPRMVGLPEIEKAVCAAFNLPSGELRGDAKSRTVSQPRILAMYLARQHTNAAFSEIGRYFGNRNHSTVIAAYRRAEDWIKANQAVGGTGNRGLKVQEAIDTVENLLRIG